MAQVRDGFTMACCSLSRDPSKERAVSGSELAQGLGLTLEPLSELFKDEVRDA